MTIKEFKNAGNEILVSYTLTTYCQTSYDKDNDYDNEDFDNIEELLDRADGEGRVDQEDEDFDEKTERVTLIDKNGNTIVRNVAPQVAETIISLM